MISFWVACTSGDTYMTHWVSCALVVEELLIGRSGAIMHGTVLQVLPEVPGETYRYSPIMNLLKIHIKARREI